MQFIQSIRDFPQMVTLGGKTPSFGLHRFKQGLRFVPFDDEGFTLRGDRRRIEYKGRRRSHRFTILGDTAFEYDCILNREPDSNVIRLRIEGADKYDFFRQPDFVKDPFLKGSYAVYKKEKIIGEGTGKICHIHRPEIIDARGRRCWGELAVVGNELRITVPEQWLADAKYPVVVDPVIGTTTVGSLDKYYVGVFPTMLICSYNIVLNKVFISESIGSNMNFYIYKNIHPNGVSNIYDSYPCLYNNENNLPKNRISENEELIVDPYNALQPGWLQAGLSKKISIIENDYIWFGIRAYNFALRFDYGGLLEIFDVWKAYYYGNNLLPDVLGTNLSPSITTEYDRELLVSMYLTYEGAGNTYRKTLVETARLNDTFLKRQAFSRKGIEATSINDRFSKKISFLRKGIEIIRIDDTFSKVLTFFRRINETARLGDTISKAQAFFRYCFITASNNVRLSGGRIVKKTYSVIDTVVTDTRLFIKLEYNRKCTQAVKAVTAISKVQTIFRTFVEKTKINMTLNTLLINPIIRFIADSVRAKSRLFPSRGLYRKVTDTLKAKGVVIRRLFVFLRILTKSVVKTVINKRLLNSKIELTIKSRIGGEEK